MTLWQQQEYLVRNRTFPFLLYYCVHFPIATNRIAMRFAVRSVPPFSYRTKRTDYYKGGTVSGTAARRFANLRITPTIPKAELEAAHSRRRNLKRLTAAKTAGTFYPCLPFNYYQYHAVKPHCKAK